jgi:proteasome lid subunit RPN8/RPN11
VYVTISTDALATIRAHVSASGKREACGLLLGTGSRVDQAVACPNVAADPACRFEIDPAMLLAAHRSARSGGLAVLGCYHSHPSGSSIPSARDAAAAAADGTLWLIVGACEARIWRAVANGAVESRFDPVPCEVAAAVPEGAK